MDQIFKSLAFGTAYAFVCVIYIIGLVIYGAVGVVGFHIYNIGVEGEFLPLTIVGGSVFSLAVYMIGRGISLLPKLLSLSS